MNDSKPVKKGKLTRQGQAERRQQVLDYIRKNGQDKEYGVKSGEICAALGMSHSSLTDDIKAINSQGRILISPRGGYYKVSPCAEVSSVRPSIDRQLLRQWFILAILSETSMDYSELLKELKHNGIPCSTCTLFSDLSYLKDSGYIKSTMVYGRVLYQSGTICCADNQEVLQYRREHQTRLDNSRTHFESADSLEEKLSHIVPEDILSLPDSSHTKTGGKKNLLTDEQISALTQLEKLSYKKYRLQLCFRAPDGMERTCSMAAGLIIYSVETGEVYLLGKSGDHYAVIALDTIIFEKTCHVESGRLYNYHYGSKEFVDLYKQMFNVTVEEPVSVKVRFINLPYVREKIERLCRSRSHYARITESEDHSEFIYTDTLRGLEDFARYIRRFGKSAIAEEPPELKELLIRTSEQIEQLY